MIKASDLHQLAYNAAATSHKGSALAGYSYWWLEDERLHLISTDDFIAIHDSVPIEDDDEVIGNFQILTPLVEVKALAKLESLKEGGDTLVRYTTALVVNATGQQELQLKYAEQIDFLKYVLDDDKLVEPAPINFSFWPDRLWRVKQLKPGGYPIDMRYHHENIFQFKLGPVLRGGLADLDRTKLKEEDIFPHFNAGGLR